MASRLMRQFVESGETIVNIETLQSLAKLNPLDPGTVSRQLETCLVKFECKCFDCALVFSVTDRNTAKDLIKMSIHGLYSAQYFPVYSVAGLPLIRVIVQNPDGEIARCVFFDDKKLNYKKFFDNQQILSWVEV